MMAFHYSLIGDRAFTRRVRGLALLIAISILMVRWSPVNAIAVGDFSLEDVSGDGWKAHGILVRIDLSAKPITAQLTIERAVIAALGSAQPFSDLKLECADLQLGERRIACAHANLRGTFPSINQQQLKAEFAFDRQSGVFEFALADLRVAQGKAQVTGVWNAVQANRKSDKTHWNLNVKLANAEATQLLKLASDWLPKLPVSASHGTLAGDFEFHGDSAHINELKWRAQTRDLTAANAAGTMAAEKITLRTEGSLQLSAQSTKSFNGVIEFTSGQGYVEPIFLNFAEHRLRAELSGTLKNFDAKNTALVIQSFVVDHQDALSANGTAKVTFGEKFVVDNFDANIKDARFPGAYVSYLQPFLVGTQLNSLQTSGRIAGRISVVNNSPTLLALTLDDLALDDGRKHWQIGGLSGAVNWQKQSASPSPSRLTWQSGKLFGLTLGKAELDFTTVDRDFAITRAAHLPVLDGSVDIAMLRVTHAGQADMSLALDATVQPISVQLLSTAFGWPPFGGQLKGRLADLQLRDGVITLGSRLNAEVFDGRISIDQLRMENALGQWPRFSANIAIDHVDLEQVTNAFSFGRITGRLSGSIDRLQLFNWQPVAFDAKLFTPADDRSKHRISQRAVQSIGNLGGSGSGIAAALSTGFLRSFQDFNYARLGINCTLVNDVCTMGGVEPAKEGYYLVKGKGVPRIDIIGNATRVDWPLLVAQLKAATESEGPVVK